MSKLALTQINAVPQQRRKKIMLGIAVRESSGHDRTEQLLGT